MLELPRLDGTGADGKGIVPPALTTAVRPGSPGSANAPRNVSMFKIRLVSDVRCSKPDVFAACRRKGMQSDLPHAHCAHYDL